MAGDPNLYDELERAIARARAALPSSGDATDLSSWPEEEQRAQDSLVRDFATLQAHRYRGTQTVLSTDERSVCETCRKTRPCTTVLELAEAYGVGGEGRRQSSADADGMSHEAIEGDRVGQCACGVSNRQTHLRVSRPGKPEKWMRSKFECDSALPGPHFRIP